MVNVVNILNQAGGMAEGGDSAVAGPAPQVFPDVNDDGDVSPGDALAVINFLNAEGENDPVVRYIARTFDAAGNQEINTIGVGQEFQLQVWVDDLRQGVASPGVFAGYLDVLYDSSLASVSGAVVHNSAVFGNAPNANIATPGILDAVGSFSKSFSGSADPQLMWTLNFTADAPGSLTFTGEPTTEADDPGDENQSPKFDTNLFGLNSPISPASGPSTGSMEHLPATITIVEDVAAVDDTYTFGEDSSNNTMNVLANDILNTGNALNLVSFTQPSAGGTVSQSGNDLLFTPTPDFFTIGGAPVTFSYTISNDATPPAMSTGDVEITVTPINDGPINTVPGPKTMDEDTSLVFNNELSVSDKDADAGSGIEVTLSASVTLSKWVGVAVVPQVDAPAMVMLRSAHTMLVSPSQAVPVMVAGLAAVAVLARVPDEMPNPAPATSWKIRIEPAVRLMVPVLLRFPAGIVVVPEVAE
ncbi:MAG: Ig-like domain-containing protein [Pirellulales bacterium]